MNLIFCFFITLFSSNGLEYSISKLYLYDTTSSCNLANSNINSVEVDSSELSKMITIINNAKSKKRAMYKPAANSLYGKIEIDGILINIRISSDIIYINKGEKKYFLIKSKEDIKWMDSFVNKYILMIKCNKAE